jgi:hypothetical protein
LGPTVLADNRASRIKRNKGTQTKESILHFLRLSISSSLQNI